MIISISGAQGQGKSTVLKTIEEQGYKVIPNKTARSILEDWDVTLEEVYSDKLLSRKFHDLILKRHEQTCAPHVDSNELVFIERSYADIFSYAVNILGPFNDYSKWVTSFHEKCKALQIKQFKIAVYLTGRTYTPSNDGVRSTNIHFAKSIDLMIRNYMDEFTENKQPFVSTVKTSDNLKRVEQIITVAKIIQEKL